MEGTGIIYVDTDTVTETINESKRTEKTGNGKRTEPNRTIKKTK